MPRKANTMNLEELSGLCDLGSSPNQQGCFSQSQTDQRTAEVLCQCSSKSGPQCWSYSELRKRQELLMSYWCSWESHWHSSEAPLWSCVCNHILCWTGAEVRCRSPDPDIQEDTFWGNQNSQWKVEDSNRGQGKLPEMGRGDKMKESILYPSEWEILRDWVKDTKL